MIFLQPWWLAGAPVLLMAGGALYALSRRLRRKRIQQFLTERQANQAMTWRHEGRRAIPLILQSAALALICLALARPLTGPKSGQSHTLGVDLYIGLDLSKSMGVADVSPSRLVLAKEELKKWRERRLTDRIGLLPFAGEAFVNLPLTTDVSSFKLIVDQANPFLMLGGSDMAKAIETAMADFAENKEKVKSPVLVLISDGDDLDGEAVVEARKARGQGVRIYTVGVGTEAGGPVPNFGRRLEDKPWGQVQDEFHRPVSSKLNEARLRAVAEAGGGRYVRMTPGAEALEGLYQTDLRRWATPSGPMRAEDYDEWFWVPLALALLLLMVEPWARTRRGKSVQEPDLPPLTLPAGAAEGAGSPERAGSVMQRRLHGLASLKILFFLLLPAVALSQAVEEKELTAWLQQKKYPELEGRLQKAIQDDYQNWVAIYDLGLVYYAQKKYSEALDCFEKALSSPDESLRDKAYFQLGNAQVRLSENSWQGNLAALDTALQNYRQLEKTKLRQEGQHNAEVTLALLRQTALKQGKDILEKTLAVPPPAATQDPKPYIDQNRGLQRVVETVEVLLRYEENQAEAQALKQKASEAWASNLDKMASLDEAVAEKKFAEGPPNQPAFHAGLRAQENALRRLEQAKELAPTDAALQAHYEKAKNREVEQLLASAEAYRQKGDFYALEQAGQALDMAEGYAPGDERVKKLREEVRAALEAAALQQADQYALNFEKSAQTPAERNEGAARQAALFLNRSIEMYRKVLDVNAANERAKAQLAKLEPKQAEIFAKMGQTELAVAKKALASSKEALSKVKEAVGHLQNAENGFTQAQALGQNSPEIQGAHEEAAKMLTELQTQMDQMLAQNPPPQEPKQNPPGDGVSAPPAQVFTYQRLRQLTVRQTQGNNKPPPAVKRDW